MHVALEHARRLLESEYELLAPLGQGGYATVFKGRRRDSGQVVAIKLQCLPEDRDSKARGLLEGRFAREVKLCESLAHPGIVKLLDSGRRGDLLFMALEFVPGETLAQLLTRRHNLTAEETVHLMLQVLDALEHAHSRGIVHRDLKPENMIVIGSGQNALVKVLDFGVAALQTGFGTAGQTLTGNTDIVGTPCYAAPEQLRGEKATTRSDIYAWGLVFLECLLGERVMAGATLAQILHKQLSPNEVFLAPALANHALGPVLRRVLAKPAKERPEAAQLRSELQQLSMSNLIIEAERQPSELRGTLVVPLQPATQRRVTALCYGLRVSAANGAQADIEVIDALERDQLRLCNDTVRRRGGYVLGNLGSRGVALFGLEHATETDARRAARAALDLLGLAHRRNQLGEAAIQVSLRVGLHTDVVLVDGTGTPAGPAINWAMELEAQAESNIALASSASYESLRRHVPFKPSNKTFDEQRLGAFELLEPQADSAPAGQDSESDLIGREAELEQLLGAWTKARAGNGGVWLVRGEPGIGKSRLARELMNRARRAGAQTTNAQCEVEDGNTALRPLLGELGERWLLALTAKDATEPALPHTATELVGILRAWTGLNAPPDASTQLSAERQREVVLEGLISLLCVGFGEGPHLVVIEDLQWADATTRELIARLSRVAERHAVLVLVTSRPDFTQPAQTVRVLELGRIEREAATQLARARANRELAEHVLADIVDRTDGIPLYVEELTRSVANGHYTPHASSPVPGTLRELLDSRLDRLGELKETLQLAAVIGREFDVNLLASSAELSSNAIAPLVDGLVGLEMLERLPRPDGHAFRFRHGLLRDAAWESMLPAKRRAAHRLVATALERQTYTGDKAEPARLAWHYEHAGEMTAAARYRLDAASFAVSASAFPEAIEHLQAALLRLSEISADPIAKSRQLDVLNKLGGVLLATQGFGTETVVDTFTRAAALLAEIDAGHEQRFTTLNGLWTFHNARASYATALELAGEMRQLAGETRVDLRAVAEACMCQTLVLRGEFSEAINLAPVIGSEFDFESQMERIGRYGLDPWLTALTFGSITKVLLGDIAGAERQMDFGFTVIARLGLPSHEASFLGQAALVNLFIGGFGTPDNPALHLCVQHCTRALDIAGRYGLTFAQGFAGLLLAMVGAQRGDERSVATLEHGLQVWAALGLKATKSWSLASLAQGRAACGDFPAALTIAFESMKHCEEFDEGYGLSEAYRTLGLIHGHERNPAPDVGAACNAFRLAIQVARRQQAHWLELRAAYTYYQKAPSEEGHYLLASALSWFKRTDSAGKSVLVDAASALLS